MYDLIDFLIGTFILYILWEFNDIAKYIICNKTDFLDKDEKKKIFFYAVFSFLLWIFTLFYILFYMFVNYETYRKSISYLFAGAFILNILLFLKIILLCFYSKKKEN